MAIDQRSDRSTTARLQHVIRYDAACRARRVRPVSLSCEGPLDPSDLPDGGRPARALLDGGSRLWDVQVGVKIEWCGHAKRADGCDTPRSYRARHSVPGTAPPPLETQGWHDSQARTARRTLTHRTHRGLASGAAPERAHDTPGLPFDAGEQRRVGSGAFAVAGCAQHKAPDARTIISSFPRLPASRQRALRRRETHRRSPQRPPAIPQSRGPFAIATAVGVRCAR